MRNSTKETDKLINNSSTSSTDTVEYSTVSTGTFRSGADILIGSKDSVMLVQSKGAISELLQIAHRRLRNRKNKEQANQAFLLLDAIADIVKRYPDLDTSGLRMGVEEDNSIWLSWRVEKTLFGASIKADTQRSSWFLVQGDGERGYKADGYLSELDYEIQLPAQIQIVINTLLRRK